MRGVLQSSFRRYVCATKVVRRFPKALRLVKKPNDEVASEDPSASLDALGATHLDYAVLWSVDEHDMLLYIAIAAAQTGERKQDATFNGRACYLYAASLLQMLWSMHSSARRNHPSSRDDVLLIKTPQRKTFSLLVRKVHLNAVSLFSIKPVANKESLAARANSRTHRVVCAFKKHCSLEEWLLPPVTPAERCPPPFAPRAYCQLKKRASPGDLGLI